MSMEGEKTLTLVILPREEKDDGLRSVEAALRDEEEQSGESDGGF